MSKIQFEKNGFEVEMFVSTDGRIRGEVFTKGDRFGELRFSVGGTNAPKGQRDISVSAGSVAASGDAVFDLVNKFETAKSVAVFLEETQNEFEDPKTYLRLIDGAYSVPTQIYLALTPRSMDPECIKTVLRKVAKTGCLGTITTTEGLESASDSAFGALLNVALILGYEKPPASIFDGNGNEIAVNPNEKLAEFLAQVTG